VGKRSAFDTLNRIYVAFFKETSWTQVALAQEVGITVRALRKRLLEMQEGGVRVDQDDEPPHVVWTVPNGWLPEGVRLQGEDATLALRLVARSPKSAARDRLLRRIVASASGLAPVPVNSAPLGEEEPILTTLEDACAQRCAVHMRYYTASRGDESWRHASVVDFLNGPRMKVIAFCHVRRKLRTFRVSSVLQVRLDAGEPFHDVPDAEVAALKAASIDGWTDGGAPRAVTFVVRGDDARWVAKNLPAEGMKVEPCDGGIRVSAVTSGVGVLARFVAGLGGAAIVETPPELAERVVELAKGALARSVQRAPARGVVKARSAGRAQEGAGGGVR
jgi:predicted DNA-binding transcriptional regulator YafY